MMQKKGVFLVGIAVCTLVVGGWWFFNNHGNIIGNEQKSTSLINASSLLTYTDYNNRFSFSYPSSFTPFNANEDDHELELFKEQGTDREFQMAILPYDGGLVTPEAIKRDSPDIVIENGKLLLVGGEQGVSFQSKEGSVDTYEIWFAKDGYLYQLSTYIPNAGLLDTVVSSFKFLVPYE